MKRMRRIYKNILLFLITLIVLSGATVSYFLFFYKYDERAIKKLIFSFEKGFEKKDYETIERGISDKFKFYNDMDKPTAMQYIKDNMENVISLSIKIKEIKLQIKSPEAQGEISFFSKGFLEGESVYDKIPFAGIASTTNEPDIALAKFIKEDKTWRLSYVELRMK